MGCVASVPERPASLDRGFRAKIAGGPRPSEESGMSSSLAQKRSSNAPSSTTSSTDASVSTAQSEHDHLTDKQTPSPDQCPPRRSRLSSHVSSAQKLSTAASDRLHAVKTMLLAKVRPTVDETQTEESVVIGRDDDGDVDELNAAIVTRSSSVVSRKIVEFDQSHVKALTPPPLQDVSQGHPPGARVSGALQVFAKSDDPAAIARMQGAEKKSNASLSWKYTSTIKVSPDTLDRYSGASAADPALAQRAHRYSTLTDRVVAKSNAFPGSVPVEKSSGEITRTTTTATASTNGKLADRAKVPSTEVHPPLYNLPRSHSLAGVVAPNQPQRQIIPTL